MFKLLKRQISPSRPLASNLMKEKEELPVTANRQLVADVEKLHKRELSVPVYSTIKQAIDAGYHVFDKDKEGYIMRRREINSWTLALVSFHGA